jgi:hypothetical protein
MTTLDSPVVAIRRKRAAQHSTDAEEIHDASGYLSDAECAEWEANRAALRRSMCLPDFDDPPAEEQGRAA